MDLKMMILIKITNLNHNSVYIEQQSPVVSVDASIRSQKLQVRQKNFGQFWAFLVLSIIVFRVFQLALSDHKNQIYTSLDLKWKMWEAYLHAFNKRGSRYVTCNENTTLQINKPTQTSRWNQRIRPESSLLNPTVFIRSFSGSIKKIVRLYALLVKMGGYT